MARRGLRPPNEPLWPDPYAEDSIDALHNFLFDLVWTWNEAENDCQQMPDLPHIEWASWRWFETRRTGTPLIIEKSRRLVMSWCMTACELWSMGLRRESRVVCGLNYPKAAEHVWRTWFVYDQMRARCPDLKLPPVKSFGSLAKMELDAVSLANSSLITNLNQEGESFQGSGYTGVRMEEFSLYKNPSYMWGQAKIVCQASAGEKGGHRVVVTNASPNIDWQEVKKCSTR